MKPKNNNNALVENNIGLVYHTIKRCFNFKIKDLSSLKLTKDDLYQQGKLGLIEASQRYDERRGKFSTFACRLIRDYIYKMIKDGYKNSFVPLLIDIPDYNSIEKAEMMIDFERCCKKYLKQKDINIVCDHIFEGLTFKEIFLKNDMENEMQAFRIYNESIQKIKRQICIDLHRNNS
ncbi:MAG: sigma factor [Candidatus Thorarchaeota archaeon]